MGSGGLGTGVGAVVIEVQNELLVDTTRERGMQITEEAPILTLPSSLQT